MLKQSLTFLFNFLIDSEDETEKVLISKCVNGHLFKINHGFCKYCISNNKTEEIYLQPIVGGESNSKKDELLENLSYLKSKLNKTKQDNESMYTLEMVLKNMK